MLCKTAKNILKGKEKKRGKEKRKKHKENPNYMLILLQ